MKQKSLYSMEKEKALLKVNSKYRTSVTQS